MQYKPRPRRKIRFLLEFTTLFRQLCVCVRMCRTFDSVFRAETRFGYTAYLSTSLHLCKFLDSCVCWKVSRSTGCAFPCVSWVLAGFLIFLSHVFPQFPRICVGGSKQDSRNLFAVYVTFGFQAPEWRTYTGLPNVWLMDLFFAFVCAAQSWRWQHWRIKVSTLSLVWRSRRTRLEQPAVFHVRVWAPHPIYAKRT